MSIDDSFCCCYLCYLLWLCFQTHSQLYWLMYQRYTFPTTWWRCSPMIWRLNWLWSAEASFVFTVLIEFPFVRQGFCFVDFVLLLNWLSQCQFVDWFVGSVFVNWFSSLNSFVCLSSFFTLRRFVCVCVCVWAASISLLILTCVIIKRVNIWYHGYCIWSFTVLLGLSFVNIPLSTSISCCQVMKQLSIVSWLIFKCSAKVIWADFFPFFFFLTCRRREITGKNIFPFLMCPWVLMISNYTVFL